jgi:hypothetical protein
MSKKNLNALTLVAAALFISLVSITSFAQSGLYPNPTEAENQRYRNKPCADPWVSRAWVDLSASTEVAPGMGSVGACDTNIYNGGRWSSYAELVGYVRGVRNSLYQQRAQFRSFTGRNRERGVALLDLNERGAVLGGWIVGTNGGNIIAADAQRIVASGGGNIVASGAGNIITNAGSNYSLQATGAKRVIKLPNAAIIIK